MLSRNDLVGALALSLFASLPLHAQEAVTRDPRLTLSPVSASSQQLFGSAVAADSGLAVFGAPGANSGQGTATVFDRGSGNSWSAIATLTGSDTAASDGFGRGVALDGDIIVVGAPAGPGSASVNQGAAYVFRWNGSSWAQVAKLTASDGATGDEFGAAVAMKGDTVIVGAPGADVSGAFDRGAAYIFTNTSGNTWSQQAKVVASNGALGDRFGSAVAMTSSRALVGAPDRAAGTGGAYIFRQSSGSWIQAVALSAGEAGAIGFGSAVALSGTLAGDWAFVGAPEAENGGLASGAVFVYQRVTDTNWSSAARLSDSDGAAGDAFGASVAAADDRVVAGAPLDTVRGVNAAGSARMFRRMANGTWQEGAKLAAASGSTIGGFGNAAAIAGERVMLGAPTTDNGSTDRGAGYHYKLDYVRAGIDDNGRSDVIWFAPGSGHIAAWSMNGLSRESAGILPTAIGTAYSFEGVGDFFGDGRAAILFRHKSNGSFRMWRLDGLSVSEDRTVSGGISFEWEYLSLGDISGDGKADVLFRNRFTGQVNGWIMSGSTKASGGVVGNSLGLTYAGLGDLDGDGRADLLWRTETGQMRAWLMNGLTIVSDIAIGNAGLVDATWRVVAMGDLDGDGDQDIVWRNTASGAVSGWIMQDASLVTSGTMHPGIPLAWYIESAGDLNGDGTDDILWRNLQSGDVNAWLMNGLVKTSGGFIKTVSSQWSILNDDDSPHDDDAWDDNGFDDNGFDDNGGANGNSGSGNGGGGGGGGGAVESVTAAQFNAALASAASASALPLLEAEVEREGTVLYLKTLKWRASDGFFVRVVVNIASGAVVSSTSFEPSESQVDKYADALLVVDLATRDPAAAVSQVVAANAGSTVVSVALEEQSGQPKWEVEILTAAGTTTKIKVAAN
ncbi:MAG: FG-GAP-like repeat-containing protein [Phycisphaerales bacterium]